MPTPVLPDGARNMSNAASTKLRDDPKIPIETFSILYYGGSDGEAAGLFEEIDRDTWTERTGGEVHVYEEIEETADQVVLYDASRDRTVTIDWVNLDLVVSDAGQQTQYEIIDYDVSLWA